MRRRGEKMKQRPAVTLFQRQAGSSRLDIVQYEGGDLSIICDDEVIGMRRWRPGDIESCIEVFLRLAQEAYEPGNALTD